MGIIRTQSIIGAVWVYAGALLGFVISALLFPHYFTQEQVGLFSLLVTYAVLFAQFASAGFLHTINRMFPYFRNDEKRHNGFLFFTLMVVSIASILLVGVYFIAEPFIVGSSLESNPLFEKFARLIIPLFLSIVFFNIFDFYSKSLFNATRGVFLKEMLLRIFILCFMMLYIFDFISFQIFVYAYIVSYVAILIIIVVALFSEGQLHLQPDFTLLTKPMIREVANVSAYGLLTSAAGFIILNIDRIMIEKLIPYNSLAAVGIYATCTYFSTMIILPSRPLLKITSTLVAEAWKVSDIEQLKRICEKSTITQFIVGILVFAGLIINIEYIFEIIPKSYQSGTWVIIWIGLFYLSEMLSGANNVILGSSPRYRSISLFTLIFILLIIVLNFIFIPHYGIVGAAFASFLAKVLYNFITYWYLYRTYKVQPYSYKHLIIIVVAAVSFFVAYIVPEHSWFVINIAIKSSLLVVLFSVGIYYSRVSEDFNQLANSAFAKIKQKL